MVTKCSARPARPQAVHDWTQKKSLAIRAPTQRFLTNSLAVVKSHYSVEMDAKDLQYTYNFKQPICLNRVSGEDSTWARKNWKLFAKSCPQVEQSLGMSKHQAASPEQNIIEHQPPKPKHAKPSKLKDTTYGGNFMDTTYAGNIAIMLIFLYTQCEQEIKLACQLIRFHSCWAHMPAPSWKLVMASS